MIQHNSKDFRLVTQIDAGSRPDVSQVTSSPPKPSHIVTVSIPRAVPTTIKVRARITSGAGTLLSFKNQAAGPDRWEGSLPGVRYGKPGVHTEPIVVHPPSGAAKIAVEELERPDGFGNNISHLLSAEIDLQVN